MRVIYFLVLSILYCFNGYDGNPISLNRVPQISVVFVFVELVLIKCLLTSFHPVLCMYGVVWIIPVIPVSATYLGSPSWRSARVPGPEE